MFIRKIPTTKRPSEVNRDGLNATAWLPLAGGSVFIYASANPSRKSGSLLAFPGCAPLSFPQRPSAQSDVLFNRSPLMDTNIAAALAQWKSPIITLDMQRDADGAAFVYQRSAHERLVICLERTEGKRLEEDIFNGIAIAYAKFDVLLQVRERRLANKQNQPI